MAGADIDTPFVRALRAIASEASAASAAIKQRETAIVKQLAETEHQLDAAATHVLAEVASPPPVSATAPPSIGERALRDLQKSFRQLESTLLSAPERSGAKEAASDHAKADRAPSASAFDLLAANSAVVQPAELARPATLQEVAHEDETDSSSSRHERGSRPRLRTAAGPSSPAPLTSPVLTEAHSFRTAIDLPSTARVPKGTTIGQSTRATAPSAPGRASSKPAITRRPTFTVRTGKPLSNVDPLISARASERLRKMHQAYAQSHSTMKLLPSSSEIYGDSRLRRERKMAEEAAAARRAAVEAFEERHRRIMENASATLAQQWQTHLSSTKARIERIVLGEVQRKLDTVQTATAAEWTEALTRLASDSVAEASKMITQLTDVLHTDLAKSLQEAQTSNAAAAEQLLLEVAIAAERDKENALKEQADDLQAITDARIKEVVQQVEEEVGKQQAHAREEMEARLRSEIGKAQDEARERARRAHELELERAMRQLRDEHERAIQQAEIDARQEFESQRTAAVDAALAQLEHDVDEAKRRLRVELEPGHRAEMERLRESMRIAKEDALDAHRSSLALEFESQLAELKRQLQDDEEAALVTARTAHAAKLSGMRQQLEEAAERTRALAVEALQHRLDEHIESEVAAMAREIDAETDASLTAQQQSLEETTRQQLATVHAALVERGQQRLRDAEARLQLDFNADVERLEKDIDARLQEEAHTAATQFQHALDICRETLTALVGLAERRADSTSAHAAGTARRRRRSVSFEATNGATSPLSHPGSVSEDELARSSSRLRRILNDIADDMRSETTGALKNTRDDAQPLRHRRRRRSRSITDRVIGADSPEEDDGPPHSRTDTSGTIRSPPRVAHAAARSTAADSASSTISELCSRVAVHLQALQHQFDDTRMALRQAQRRLLETGRHNAVLRCLIDETRTVDTARVDDNHVTVAESSQLTASVGYNGGHRTGASVPGSGATRRHHEAIPLSGAEGYTTAAGGSWQVQPVAPPTPPARATHPSAMHISRDPVGAMSPATNVRHEMLGASASSTGMSRSRVPSSGAVEEIARLKEMNRSLLAKLSRVSSADAGGSVSDNRDARGSLSERAQAAIANSFSDIRDSVRELLAEQAAGLPATVRRVQAAAEEFPTGMTNRVEGRPSPGATISARSAPSVHTYAAEDADGIRSTRHEFGSGVQPSSARYSGNNRHAKLAADAVNQVRSARTSLGDVSTISGSTRSSIVRSASPPLAELRRASGLDPESAPVSRTSSAASTVRAGHANEHVGGPSGGRMTPYMSLVAGVREALGRHEAGGHVTRGEQPPADARGSFAHSATSSTDGSSQVVGLSLRPRDHRGGAIDSQTQGAHGAGSTGLRRISTAPPASSLSGTTRGGTNLLNGSGGGSTTRDASRLRAAV